MRTDRHHEWLDPAALPMTDPDAAADGSALLRTDAGELRVRVDAFDGLRIYDSRLDATAPMDLHPQAMREGPLQCMQVALAGRALLRVADGGRASVARGTGGMFRVDGDGARYRCGPGQLHLVGVSADIPLLARWFGPKVPAPLRPMLHDGARSGQLVTLPVPAVESAAMAVAHVPFHGVLRRMMLEGIAMQMLGGFLDTLCGSDAPVPSLSARELRAAREAYERLLLDMRSPPGATELARSVGISPRRLDHAFRTLHGGSVFAVLRRERLSHAFAALRAGHLPVKTIAWQVGYDHVASFTHAFKHRFGLAPSAVREGRGRRMAG